MKVPLDIAGPAVGSYYDGLPLNTITKDIIRKHRIYVSDSTIFNWVDKFTRLGTNDNKSHNPIVADTWIVNETEVNVCGVDYHLVDIIDYDTEFIISTMFFDQLSKEGFNRLLQSARERVGKMPGSLYIMGSIAGLNLIALEDGARKKRINVNIPDDKKSRELAEHIRDSFLIRNQVLSRLKKKENIRKIINGWLVHYNYRRPNESLNGQTPAEKAGIHII